MAYFLVERYVPSMTTAELEAAMARVATASDDDVRHVWTILVRHEDTCLSVFEAPASAAVVRANDRADFRVDRVVEVIPFES